MIIVEGPDGAGKTTLVRHLVAKFPELRVGERGTKNRDLLWTVTVPDTMKALSRFALSQGHITIWDRLYYSELVYAPLRMPPRAVAFNECQSAHVQRILHSGGIPFILCMPPREVVVANILDETRHEAPGVKENAGRIWDSYMALVQDNTFPEDMLLYDYTDRYKAGYSLDEIDTAIQDYIDEKRARCW